MSSLRELTPQLVAEAAVGALRTFAPHLLSDIFDGLDAGESPDELAVHIGERWDLQPSAIHYVKVAAHYIKIREAEAGPRYARR